MDGPSRSRPRWSRRPPRSSTPTCASAAARAARRPSTWPGALSRTAWLRTSGGSAPMRPCLEPIGIRGARAPD
eukprot:3527660-Alexandrium_andersonii.AAC.1